MAIQGVRWCSETLTWHEESKLHLDTATCQMQLWRGKDALVSYCASRIGLNEGDDGDSGGDDEIKWIAVFCTRETDTDTPLHMHQLPFPFNLPLYPQRNLYFIMYSKKSRHAASAAPFLLGYDQKVHSTSAGLEATPSFSILPLTLDSWHQYCQRMKEDPTIDVYSNLQHALDIYWNPDDACDDEFVENEEVETDLLLLQQIAHGKDASAPGQGAGTVLVGTSTGSGLGSSSGPGSGPGTVGDDDWNEDDAIVDALTGFVVEPHTATLSDDDIDDDESNSSSEEHDDDEDEDDDDDEECEVDAEGGADDDDSALGISLLL